MVIPYLLDDETKLIEMLADRDLGDTDYHVVLVHSDEESAFKGIELVREGKVDFIMKGNIQTGSLLKQVVNRETGIRDRDVLSHLALIEVPKYPKLLGVTDGGMLLAPDADQKEARSEERRVGKECRTWGSPVCCERCEESRTRRTGCF